MKALAVSDLSLILSFALVLVSMAISWKEKLGLTRDIFLQRGPGHRPAGHCRLRLEVHHAGQQCPFDPLDDLIYHF